MSVGWMSLGGEDYFLSARNPCATTEQRALQELALRVMAHPDVQRARAIVSVLWKNAAAYPARHQMDLFDAAVEEYVFYYVLRAVNGDGDYPKILRYMDPPGHWFGQDVPGSRWGGSSPNFIYRCIPLTHGARYEIHGRPSCAEAPGVTYSLTTESPTPATLAVLDSTDMVFAADGSFRITIDAEPANGRPNHIQTRPVEHYLQVRDALGDWLSQTPNALRITRLDAPARAQLSENEIVKRAARLVQEGFFYAYYCTQSGNGQAPNDCRAPVSSAAFGGMATQWGSKGNLDLAEDEALIMTANSAGAGFRDVILCSLFFTSLDFWDQTNCFNMAQMAPDADGRFTYVIAHRDPGVHNWLDTGGRRQLIFGQRWQAFGPRGAVETPSFTAKLVKFAALEAHLPSGVPRVDRAGRAAQRAARAEGFYRRFLDD